MQNWCSTGQLSWSVTEGRSKLRDVGRELLRVGLFQPHCWVRGVGRESRIRFCVEISLADYKCLLCGKEALPNSHPSSGLAISRQQVNPPVLGVFTKRLGAQLPGILGGKLNQVTLLRLLKSTDVTFQIRGNVTSCYTCDASTLVQKTIVSCLAYFNGLLPGISCTPIVQTQYSSQSDHVIIQDNHVTPLVQISYGSHFSRVKGKPFQSPQRLDNALQTSSTRIPLLL